MRIDQKPQHRGIETAMHDKAVENSAGAPYRKPSRRKAGQFGGDGTKRCKIVRALGDIIGDEPVCFFDFLRIGIDGLFLARGLARDQEKI